MKRRAILPLSLPELEALPTKRLLARLKRLHECEESPELSDRPEAGSGVNIEFKQSRAWSEAYQQLKQVLAAREHVAKGMELLAKRKARKPR